MDDSSHNFGAILLRVAGKSGESGVGTPGGGMAHRGRLLVFIEDDADAAARGVFDGLFGLVVV